MQIDRVKVATIQRAVVLGLVATAVLVFTASAGANHNLRDRVSVGAIGGNGNFDQTFRGSSVDGSRVFFTTDEPLVAGDTDVRIDLYERAGSTTTKISPGNGDSVGQLPFDVTYAGASDDGTRVFFNTDENLTGSDTDLGGSDIYESFNGAVSHVSTSSFGGNGGYDAQLLDTSADGTRVFFLTSEQMVDEDNGSGLDIYERSGGVTTLVSTGPNCDCSGGHFDAISADGARVIFDTSNQLVAGDTDSNVDIYRRENGATTLLTPSNNPFGGNVFAGASKDATQVFFGTGEALDPADTDGRLDIYKAQGGTITWVSTGPAGGNGAFDPTFRAVSDDGSRVIFSTSESLVSGDTDTTDDIYERSGSTTTLVSTGTVGGAPYRGTSSDGNRVFIVTNEKLAPADTDTSTDVYQFSGGTATVLSIGATGGNGPDGVLFQGASSDGARVFFTTGERLEPTDADSSVDIYERLNGATTLISTGPTDNNLNFQYNVYRGASANGDYVFFETGTPLVAGDTDTAQDVYQAVFDDDFDDDGLLNEWESNGVTVGGDFVNLPAMGASPTHKDVFVEVDYMTGPGFHSHRPDQAAIDKIITAFDGAPVSNPDATTGIHLHVDYGANAPLTWAPGNWGALSRSDSLTEQTNLGTGAGTAASPYDWTSFDTIKNANFTTAREPIFHYNVWAHNLSMAMGTTSGISRDLPASDFIVSLGGWGGFGTTDERAGTFMHELGHNLGLGHGGGDDVQWKPNLMSVMNYAFQTRGLIVDAKEGTFDYSRSQLPALNENSLDETAGIGSGATRGTRYFCGLGNQVFDLDASNTDWNCDSDSSDTGLMANVNQGITGNNNSTFDTLSGHDDWSSLLYDGGAVGGLGAGETLSQTTVGDELTEEQNASLPDLNPRYPRPKAASPLRVPLVPAYQPCSASNRTHGPPLAYPSCNPPQLESAQLTLGTADANGHPSNAVGYVRYGVKVGAPGGVDDTDVNFNVSLTDVRKQGTLADYTGELQAVAVARITDRINGPAAIEPSTVSDLSFPVTVPCTATGGTADIGATCVVSTTLDAVMPGAIPEGKRSVWGLQQVKVFDGGPDDDVDTTPNTLFAVQGVFVP